MSQHDRILNWLKERGPLGVHSFEMVEQFMPRGAAVIKTLRDEGYEIESRREPYRGKSKGVRYVLKTSAVISRSAVDSGEKPPQTPPMFAGAGASSGAFDPYSDWS